MKSTLPGAMRPDRSAAPLMPMAASGACATIEPSVSIKRMLRNLNSTPGPSGERCRIASSIFTWRSESSPLMALLDHGDEARHGDRPLGEPAVAANDGDHADNEDAGEDLAAHMGAARRYFPELELNRFGHELDELPALRRQSHERPAAFGDLDESACHRLARGGGTGFAPPALDGAAEIFGIDPQERCRAANLSGVRQGLHALGHARGKIAQGTHQRKRRLGYGQQALPQLAHGPLFR